MAKKQTTQKMVITEMEECHVGTIGWIFDRYRKRGSLNENLTINSDKFKSNGK